MKLARSNNSGDEDISIVTNPYRFNDAGVTNGNGWSERADTIQYTLLSIERIDLLFCIVDSWG